MKIINIFSIILIIFGIIVSFIPFTISYSKPIYFPSEAPNYVFANINHTFSTPSDCTIKVSWNGTWDVMLD